MDKIKTYFVNLWAAIRGKPIVVQGGGGSGEEKPK